MQDLIGVNLTSVRTEAEGPEFAVGTIGCVTTLSEDNGTLVKTYKYVKFNNGTGNVASVASKVAYYYGATGYTVTMDVSDSTTIGAGVFQAVIADLGYGWVQIAGKATLAAALTAGTTAGSALTAVGTTDGTLDVSALVTDFICATTLDAVTDANAPVIFLTCPQ